MSTSQNQARPLLAAMRTDSFIPLRNKEIVAALTRHGSLADERAREGFQRLCRVLAAICHNEFFALLERLRDDYAYFTPDRDPHTRLDEAAQERAYADLVATFEAVMRAADFVEVPTAEIARAHREHPVLRVEVRTPDEDFRQVRFFTRGRHAETCTATGWFGLRRRVIEAEVRDDVVLFAAVQPQTVGDGPTKHWARSKLRPGSVLLKYFRNIPTSDLTTLYPNVRVVMSTRDKLMLVVPALVGVVPLGLKLVTTASILFLVLGAYLGFQATIEGDRLTTAFAVMSGIVALGGFLMQHWLNYQSRSLKHQKALADAVYFRNINNNAGLFDYIVGIAEEQQTKEALLAYHFLHAAPAPQTKEALAAAVEAWLKETFAMEASFAAAEALARLDRLGLLTRHGELVSVPPLDRALVVLDDMWANFHRGEAAVVAHDGRG